MIAEAVNLTRETYAAVLLDRDAGGPVVIGSPAGGVDIEEVAEKTPNLIFKVPLLQFSHLPDSRSFVPF